MDERSGAMHANGAIAAAPMPSGLVDLSEQCLRKPIPLLIQGIPARDRSTYSKSALLILRGSLTSAWPAARASIILLVALYYQIVVRLSTVIVTTMLHDHQEKALLCGSSITCSATLGLR